MQDYVDQVIFGLKNYVSKATVALWGSDEAECRGVYKKRKKQE